jgi:hypothetical protein
MSKNSIILTYEDELDRLKKEKTSLDELQPDVLIKINEIKPPISQLDEVIAELTVEVNKKIQTIFLTATASANCGCGKTTTITVLENNIPVSYTIDVGTVYYYEHAKTRRMSAEDINYIGTNPYEPLSGTDGSTNFNSGIGSDTIVVGANSNSILELIISNAGTGYASTLSPYYSQELVGGSGSGAKVDVTVGAGASVITKIAISNSGSGYAVGDSLSIVNFPGASFLVSDVGSPILGVGTETYIVSSSGIGSVFVQDVDVNKISSCSTSCSLYNTQINTLVSELNSLRTQRQILLNGVNPLKKESERFFLQSYSYSFARGQVNLRISQIDNVISVLTDNTFDSYFS